MKTVFNASLLAVIVAASSLHLYAYDGSETFLHYHIVPDAVRAGYQSVCRSIVLSDTASDTLKNAKNEFDIAIPKLLGGSALPMVDGAGAIVLAERGSAPVASAGIDYSVVGDEGFIIKSAGGKTYITGKNQVAVLRGAFHFIRLMQTAKSIWNLSVVENPCFPFRVLDHWYNHYGSGAEAYRLYGGNRLFKMENFGSLGDEEKKRIIDYCRMAASLGLNGMCPTNMNVYQSGSIGNFKSLEVSNLKTQRFFADIIGTYGLRYYLTVADFCPRLVTPKISSAALRSDSAKQWWLDKVDTVCTYIRNFGGFLIHEEYHEELLDVIKTKSQSVNPIAEALRRHGLSLIVRASTYATSDPDFAVSQSKDFADPPQTWDSSVVLRMKDGPRDFQTIEPPHQLLAMPGVRKGMEFQISQEYTGQDKHLCWLVPKWKQVLDWDIQGASQWSGAEGTLARQLLKGGGAASGGVWGISNLSDAANWTGHYLAQANYYGYGRLAWNPELSAEEIADEWIQCSFDNGDKYGVRYILKYLLLGSWKTYTDYTIGHSALMPALGNNNHYEIDFDGMRNINFYNDWFMDFPLNGTGIGVERCGGMGGTVHNDFAHKYLTPAMADFFCNLSTCPEEHVLFFHHLGWEHKMKGGMTLIQQLQFEHFRGIHAVQRFVKYWKLLNASNFVPPLIDESIHGHVLEKLTTQLIDGSRWADTFRSQFGSRYPAQVPCQIDILTTDTTKVVEAHVGAKISLSATLASQNGTSITDGTFEWSVAGPGATLTAATGSSVTFSADRAGAYTVRVWDRRWPDQYEDELIFIGNWTNDPAVALINPAAGRVAPLSLTITQTSRRIAINSPVAGNITIVSLQGRVVERMCIEKAGTYFWETGKTARGIYLLEMTAGKQVLRDRFLVR